MHVETPTVVEIEEFRQFVKKQLVMGDYARILDYLCYSACTPRPEVEAKMPLLPYVPQDVKDAARYRFLRNQPHIFQRSGFFIGLRADGRIIQATEEFADNEIDAEMLREPQNDERKP